MEKLFAYLDRICCRYWLAASRWPDVNVWLHVSFAAILALALSVAVRLSCELANKRERQKKDVYKFAELVAAMVVLAALPFAWQQLGRQGPDIWMHSFFTLTVAFTAARQELQKRYQPAIDQT